MKDFIFNGKAHGGLLKSGTAAALLLNSGFDPGVLRPYEILDTNGTAIHNCVSVMNRATGKYVETPIQNAALLRKDEWKQYDTAIVTAARNRLGAVASLMSSGLVYNLNGMGKTVMDYEKISDVGEAQLSMDGLTRGENTRQTYDTGYLPLPIIHQDFQIGLRALSTSRNGGNAIDTTNAEVAARKVAEKIESMYFMGSSGYSFGGGVIYGLTDYPDRNTFDLDTAWDDPSVTGADILTSVLTMKQQALDDRFYGPFTLYIPAAYETKLDQDYSTAKGSDTIRERLLKVKGIDAIEVSDYLTGDNVVLVQKTSDVVRIVQGMPITPLQWEEQGGMLVNMKVMGIIVPQIRSDFNGRCGIVHGAV
jgi:uncharacterized linocin/CFP29 family protein